MSFGFSPGTSRPENFEPAWKLERMFEWKDFRDCELESQFSMVSKLGEGGGRKLLGWPLLEKFDMADSFWEL
jgi:hypothetical protein